MKWEKYLKLGNLKFGVLKFVFFIYKLIFLFYFFRRVVIEIRWYNKRVLVYFYIELLVSKF